MTHQPSGKLSNQPYVSIILVGRNDNYGGDFLARLTTCLNHLIYHLDLLQVNAEIILVNYNPIPDKAQLQDELDLVSHSPNLSVRCITVAPDYHQLLVNQGTRKEVPLFEYPAKNIGIRRAKGQFIAVINPDILIPPSIIKAWARQRLKKGVYYRCDRCDFLIPSRKSPRASSREDLIAEAKKRLSAIILKGKKYPFSSPPVLPFLLILTWTRIKNSLWLWWELFSYRYRDFLEPRGVVINPDNAEFQYHCNCSGDFMVMHKDHWEDLRGFPETSFLALHTDARFVIMAAASGMKEKVHLDPIYHQDHHRRYTWEAILEDPHLLKAYRDFELMAQEMLRKREPRIDNLPDWGLFGINFPETIM